MLKAPTELIIVFIIVSILLILILVVLISIIIFRYQQKQNIYFKEIENLKNSYQNALLQSQLEIQEQTFQNISREIHDNIGQKLTLAKLRLNTLSHDDITRVTLQVNDSVNMIGEAINDLSDLSRSMNSEVLLNNGLIKALKFEAEQLKKSGKYKIRVITTGNPVFLNANTELVLFRIAQEALTNIIKHAEASVIDILLHYDSLLLSMMITDNGKGFYADENRFGTGLSNMKKRADTLKGSLTISSTPQVCTQIKIEIPFYENNKSI